MSRIPRNGSFAAELTAAIVTKRNERLRRTVKPTSVAGVTETVTLETNREACERSYGVVLSFAEGRKAARKARRENNRDKDYSWLMAATLSTPSAYRS